MDTRAVVGDRTTGRSQRERVAVVNVDRTERGVAEVDDARRVVADAEQGGLQLLDLEEALLDNDLAVTDIRHTGAIVVVGERVGDVLGRDGGGLRGEYDKANDGFSYLSVMTGELLMKFDA